MTNRLNNKYAYKSANQTTNKATSDQGS